MKIENCKPVPLRTCPASGLKIITQALTTFLVSVPLIVNGASIYFTVPKDVVFVGDDFKMTLMLDPEGEIVNAVGGTIRLPKDTFFLKSVRTGESFVDLWIENPEEKDGAVVFSGIVPGGFSGVQEPFVPKPSPGEILTLSLRAHAPGTAVFSLEDASVLANDGKGTSLPVKMARGKVVVEEVSPQPPAPISQPPVDTTPPEPFEVTILRDPALYDNQWTAIFETQDKGSGVGYYEISEHRGAEPENYVGLLWTRAKSPHLLADQERGSHIYVKAVDNSGNIRVARVVSTSVFSRPVDKSVLALTSFGIIITLLLIIIFRKNTKRR